MENLMNKESMLMGIMKRRFREDVTANPLKRALVCVALTAVFLMITAMPAATALAADGASLSLTSSLPAKGAKNLQPQNVGIKLYFNGDVTDASVRKANEGCFKFTYKSGKKTKELPVKAYSDPKSGKGYILAIVDTKDLKSKALESNKAYNLIVSGDLRSADGKTLGSDLTLNFKTVDQGASTQIYMLLMLGMVGAMIGMTIFQNKRKARAAEEVAAKGGKVNPYKLAKDKKITVKEAMELIERDRQRRMKRLGIAEGKDEQAAAAEAVKPRDTKRVKAPRPISAAGSSYNMGRAVVAGRRAKATAEEREKELAEKLANKGGKNSSSKSKGKSKNKKKKK
jgi:hypothetical protein